MDSRLGFFVVMHNYMLRNYVGERPKQSCSSCGHHRETDVVAVSHDLSHVIQAGVELLADI